MSTVSNFLTESEKNRIIDVIRNAEANTTGEIRLHMENKCSGDAMKRAISVFHELKMDRTKFRNGILIYIAIKDKKFAILGDEAINQKIESSYWTELSQQLQKRFSEQSFADGLAEVIQKTGQTLSQHFPNLENYLKNELPDDISFD